MRADLLEIVKTEPALKTLDADLKDLLASWFDLGFLEMRRISWDAPASLLEKLGQYEAVHEVRGWSDLKNRLDIDRRCFAFMHPAMPDEPIIFVDAFDRTLDGRPEKLWQYFRTKLDAAELTADRKSTRLNSSHSDSSRMPSSA